LRTLGGDTTVNRLGFGAMRLCGPGVWGEALDRRSPRCFRKRCRPVVRLAASRAAEAQRPCKWQSLGC
jgi:hypothetical protein